MHWELFKETIKRNSNGTMETLKILSDTSVIISEGEVLEISNDKNLEMNEGTWYAK